MNTIISITNQKGGVAVQSRERIRTLRGKDAGAGAYAAVRRL